MSIRGKLLIAFLGITLLMAGLAVLGLSTLKQANDRTRQLVSDQERIAVYTEIDTALATLTMMTFAATAFDVEDSKTADFTWLKAPAGSLTSRMGDLQILVGRSIRRFENIDPTSAEVLKDVRKGLQALAPMIARIQNVREDGNQAEMKRLAHKDIAPITMRLQRDVFTAKREIESVMAERARETGVAYETARHRTTGIAAIAVGIALLLGYLISSSIIWPVRHISDALDRISRGMFDTHAQVPNRDEFGALAQGVTDMSAELAELYDRVDAQKTQLENWNSKLEDKVRRQVDELQRTNRLRRYLPKSVAQMITDAGNETDVLSSQRREVSVLFADLRGFTAFSGATPPDRVIAALNRFHETVGPLIEAHGGTLERFLGDGLVVLFNAPLTCDNPAEKALDLAEAMQAAFHPAMAPFQSGALQLGLGVGIASGTATLGQIGFEGRLDYAAIGTVPNLAARLCDHAVDGQILLCETTSRQTNRAIHALPPLSLKGIGPRVLAFEPVQQSL